MKLTLGQHFKFASSAIGWVVGPAVALVGLLNPDLPYNGAVLVLGVLIWWLAAGISYSTNKEIEAAKKESEVSDDSIDQ
jgi:hypothetical protein